MKIGMFDELVQEVTDTPGDLVIEDFSKKYTAVLEQKHALINKLDQLFLDMVKTAAELHLEMNLGLDREAVTFALRSTCHYYDIWRQAAMKKELTEKALGEKK